MNILVTGCAGFIGSWVCEKANLLGHNIIGIDNLSSNVNFCQDFVNFHNADLNSNIKSYIKNVDYVVHCAARAELRHNWDNKKERELLFHNNEMATISLLEQMPSVPIIFLSSASVYGSLSYLLRNGELDKVLSENEANPESIESPYAASKLACESYVSAWSYKRKTPWYSLRIVNQVGGRYHRGVVNDFYNMAVNNKHIHAADNGEQRKNWMSVEDTANLIMKLINSSNKIPSGCYTVSSDERWSWRDIVKVMQDMYFKKNPNSLEPFTLSWENKLAGTVGDPINLNVSTNKLNNYFKCEIPVEYSVKQALTSLGWAK